MDHHPSRLLEIPLNKRAKHGSLEPGANLFATRDEFFGLESHPTLQQSVVRIHIIHIPLDQFAALIKI